MLIVITIVCIYFCRFPYLPVGWFWYLGTLVPVIGIVQVGAQSMADRYAYIPFIGLFIIMAWGMSGIIKKLLPARVMAIISAGILMALIIIAHYQIKSWENSYTLWQQAIKVTKENFLPHKNLGLYLTDQNRPQEAAYHLRKAMELNKKDVGLHNSIGVALTRMGKLDEAKEEYKEALRLQPANARAHNNLGIVLMRLGKIDEAEKHFREAIRLELKFPQAHFFLAGILKKKGFHKEAAYHYQEARRINEKFRSGK